MSDFSFGLVVRSKISASIERFNPIRSSPFLLSESSKKFQFRASVKFRNKTKKKKKSHTLVFAVG